jgi:inhibitor of cysteine peptidase
MSQRTRPYLALFALTGGLLSLMAGCPLDWFAQIQAAGDPNSAQLHRFGSADEFLTYFKDQLNTSMIGRSGSYLYDLMPAAAPTGNAATGGEAGTSQAYTSTNLQETGVDESDLFKSDGTYFYVATGSTLRIVQATPVTALAQVGSIDLGITINSFYLNGSQVIALGNDWGSGSSPGAENPEILVWPPFRNSAQVVIKQVDVSNPAAPTVTGTIELDGSIVSSRLTGGRLYVVLAIIPQAVTTANPLTTALLTVDQVEPKARIDNQAQTLVGWQDYYGPDAPYGCYTTAVVVLDPNNVKQVIGSTAILADAGTIYASTEALYVTSYSWNPADSVAAGTNVHKFRFDADKGVRYVGSGRVPGQPLNQYSLGEYQGFLRIATEVYNYTFFDAPIGIAITGNSSTTGVSTSTSQQHTTVTILGEATDKLEVHGQVNDIAPGETMYAARFLGEHGFLVTFRKIDPLFILDLADPNNPQMLGELHVPGFSDYLHPLDATHLIGVGKASIPSETGDFDWYQGIQLSLFDVSDWAHPTAVQQITLGGRGSDSEVLRDPKAFAILSDTHRFALPLTLMTQNDIAWEYGDPQFDGIYVFDVDAATGFTHVGQIDAVTANPISSGMSWYYYNGWRRAALIGTASYAVSNDGVRAVSSTDFSTTTTLEFTTP